MYAEYRTKWLWAFVLYLCRYHYFQLVELPNQSPQLQIFTPNGDQGSVVLLKNKGRAYQMFRLTAVDAAWPSLISRDMRSFAEQVPLFQKRLKASSLTVQNLYFFAYPLEEQLRELFKEVGSNEQGKTKLYSWPLYVTSNGARDEYLGMQGLGEVLPALETSSMLSEIEQIIQTQSLAQIKQGIVEEERRQEQEFKQIFHYGKPLFTYMILAINIIVFAYLEWINSSTDLSTLIEYGAKWNPALHHREYWRFITPVFIHIGYLHLIFNSFALYFLGSLVEKIYGSVRFLWIYLFAGFTGTLASFVFVDNVSAGASGAIFGCFGALLYFGLKRRDLFFRTLGMDIIFVLLFNLGIGFAVPMIDNYGHIGGLIGGFLAAMIINLPRQSFWKERAFALVTAVLAILVLLKIGFGHDSESAMYYMIRAELELKKEHVLKAKDFYEQALHYNPQLGEAHYNLAVIEYVLGNRTEALTRLQQAKAVGFEDPRLDELYQKIVTN